MVEFLILGEVRNVVSWTATLDFQKADFGLLRDLVDRAPWEVVVLNCKACTFFKNKILKGAAAGGPNAPKGELAGEISLAETRAASGNRKKESL